MGNTEHLRGAETHSLPHARSTGDRHAHWLVEHVAETGSTQTDLLGRAISHRLRHRTARVADIQHQGRGRLDRGWDAPQGTNLLVSLGFVDVPDDPGDLMRRSALAIVAAARIYGTADVTLKWPNDVLSGGSKLAGLLAQRAAAGPVIVGCGVNVGWAPRGGARIGSSADSGGAAPSPMHVLATMLHQFDDLGDDIANRYRAELGTIGQQVRVDLGERALVGIARDVTDDGRLIVEVESGERHTVSAGDVVHLRPIAPT